MEVNEDELRQKLTPEQYRVLREHGTETPGTGELLYNEQKGEYHCPVCHALLFTSDAKYESTTPGLIGWPSFSEAASNTALTLIADNSMGMHRTEVLCAVCGSHLGHLFDDPTSPNGQHFCINSAALAFEKKA
ncbi:MAG TPA: peptide-methionine (R)-S-oxide reductase MsrB [Candidatus Saccharimonadales bacterium]|nr:peptide-methionine (R)-S-oxide reductase MsrB [Candidatus Saccharimonadales bacterium]